MPTHFSLSTSPGTASMAERFLEYVSTIACRTSSGSRSSLIFSTLFSLWFSLRNRTLYRTSHKVQTAFGFLATRPATRPGVLARGHRPGTRLAPYAAVTHAKKRIERYVVQPHVLLD